MSTSGETALIITGPAGCGKSYWIQQYAEKKKRSLFVCPCRKDRTLRDGRQKLHLWGRRTEPAILWLEGADDLTPEAQAFLRRILETHAPQVQFILECRDSSKLQDPIRSRCSIMRCMIPTWDELCKSIEGVRGVSFEQIQEYIMPHEFSYRTMQHCADLQVHFPEIWTQVLEQRRKEKCVKDMVSENIPEFIQNSYHPEILLKQAMINSNHKKEILIDYGECLVRSGSIWAFLSYVLDSKA
jgi:DNA polymerase III delta prime subunit